MVEAPNPSQPSVFPIYLQFSLTDFLLYLGEGEPAPSNDWAAVGPESGVLEVAPLQQPALCQTQSLGNVYLVSVKHL